jgi:DNA-binding beta-propeller fold protein YncE
LRSANNSNAGGNSAERNCVGEIVGMRLRRITSFLGIGLAALCLVLASGCSKSTPANVITIAINSSQGSILILGQSTTLTATVSGATNTNVNWEPCQYTTTTTDSNGKSTTSTPATCPPDPNHNPSDPNFTIFGTLSNEQATGTATFLAPNTLPDQTKYPGLQIIITAQSQQNTAKTGKITLTLNSGVSVVLNPVTATVPTNEKQQFSVTLTNDLQTKGVTWLVTQQIPTSTIPYPKLTTCSPTCGAIVPDPNNGNVAIYTAPATVPTSITPPDSKNTNAPANLTIVATSVADDSRLAIGTITIILGGPITFNGIAPTIAPQGATLWDIYLDAPNISSASIITLTDSVGGKTVKLSSSGQIKILFPIPISTTTNGVTTVTNPQSTGARLRLFSPDLAAPGPFTISVTDPGEPVTAPNPPSAYTYKILPVRPATIGTVPDDVVQGKLAQDTRIIIDGGYFGPSGNLARVFFQGTTVSQDANFPSTSRQLDTLLSTGQINSGSPGLYPISVASTATPAPSPNNPAVSTIAVFPDYSVAPPQISGPPTAAGQNPGAIDIDPILGVVVVAETGSNAVGFYSIGNGTLTPLSTVTSTAQAPINVPTAISVDRIHHTVAVVNYGTQAKDASGNLLPPTGQSVTVLPIPGAPGTPFSVDISGALQGSVSPAPMPYAIGLDPDSNLALVAYSSTSTSSAANLGFIINLNPNTADTNGNATNPYACTLGQAINSASNKFGQCIFAQVTLNNGTYPHIAMAPHGHLAFVTPGGSGVVRGVDVTRPSTSNAIASATLAAGLVTVTIDPTKCPTGVTSPCPLTMVPGNAGSVLLAGVTPAVAANSALFNGVFSVSVTSSTSFTYAVNSTVSDTGSGGTVFYGKPDLIFPISSTTQGIAINPITNTAVMADADAIGTNGPQIDLLSALDQTISSISFFATCTAFISPCSSSPELLATTDVAWQPYTNEVVSYNPQQKQVSISDPVSRQRYAIVNVSGSSAVAFPVMNGTTGLLTLWGGIAVDPKTNQAFVLESGSGPQQAGQIEIINLGPASSNTIKTTQITEVVVPSPTPGPGVIGGVPHALVPQATLTSAQPLVGLQIFGSGFASGAQVRLDSVDIATKGGTINNISPNGREMDVTIPAAFLSAPHHYSLDVISNSVQSNATEFIVVQAVDMSRICFDSSTPPQPLNTMPTSVAIADQLANGPFSPIAIVSNAGCNSVSIIDINPTITVGGVVQSNPTFGQLIGNPITVGTTPQGIAISQHLGLAVVANNGGGSASVIDLTANPPGQKVPDVSTGTNATGVAINDATGAAVVTNTGSNTVTLLNLGLLFPPAGTAPPTTLTPTSIGGIQQPIAVAIDADRGTNNQGIAVVTALQLATGQAPFGALAVVEIGLATPVLSTTIPSGSVTATPTGIVFDPTAVTGTANPGVFYSNSSGSNVITQFNPDTGGGSSVSVGINPTSLALNPQTGAILTSNSASNSISIVDTLANPFKTRKTLGFPGSPTFGVAIDPFTNLAVIVDQANNRILLFPMPN